jgi:hypothetical protein
VSPKRLSSDANKDPGSGPLVLGFALRSAVPLGDPIERRSKCFRRNKQYNAERICRSFLPWVAPMAITTIMVTAYSRPTQDMTATAVVCITLSIMLVALFGNDVVTTER